MYIQNFLCEDVAHSFQFFFRISSLITIIRLNIRSLQNWGHVTCVLSQGTFIRQVIISALISGLYGHVPFSAKFINDLTVAIRAINQH